jgi:hypothetical protein
VEVAQLPEPPRRGGEAAQQFAAAAPPAHDGFHLIASANAADAAPRHGPVAAGQWAIQVGAYANQGMAHGAVHAAQEHAHVELAVAHPYVASVHQGRTVLWRARLTGMSRETAVQACERITHGRSNCIVLSPEAQS